MRERRGQTRSLLMALAAIAVYGALEALARFWRWMDGR